MKQTKQNQTEQECSSGAVASTAGSQPEISGKVIRIDEGVVREHLDRVVVRTVEETLNALLQAEADVLCGAKRYEHSAQRVDSIRQSWPRGFSVDRAFRVARGIRRARRTLRLVRVLGAWPLVRRPKRGA